MDRWASFDVTALPLQLLLRKSPEWAERPVAVVDEDKPQGTILWVNRAAHENRVRPGLRYAAGLSLCSELCAGVVSDQEIAQAVKQLTDALRAFTPEIEPSAHEPGVFWLNASGFGNLWPTLEEWANAVAARMRELRIVASLVVGFDRFGTYALARELAWSKRASKVLVLLDPAEERTRAARVPLGVLQLDPKMREALRKLGIATVGDLRRLPAGGLLERFGREGYLLQRLADGTLEAPLEPDPWIEPVRESFEPDPEIEALDLQCLLFLVKSRLARMCRVLAERGEALARLHVCLLHEKAPNRDERIKPAAPTLDEVELVDLLRLRLTARRFEAPVVGFELAAESVAATSEQLELFADKPRRDLAAANRALARLRAEFGEEAVVHAVLRDGHLPEARFAWQELTRVSAPRSSTPRPSRSLIRRFFQRPAAVAHQKPLPDGWFVASFGAGPVNNLVGPYVVSGGWWRREVHREYYFAETRRGDVLWVFHDRRSRKWFVHGIVE